MRWSRIAVVTSVWVLATAVAAGAASSTQTGTLTRTVTATWALGDARGTVVTVTGVVTDDNTAGTLVTTATGTVTLVQSYCDTSGAQDLWTDIELASNQAYSKGVEALPNGYQRGKVAVPLQLVGTVTRTPMGHNGTCAVATGPSWTQAWDTAGKVNAAWTKDASAAPVTDQPSLDHVSWSRDAIADGSIEARVLGLRAKLPAAQASAASLAYVADTTDGSDAALLFTVKP